MGTFSDAFGDAFRKHPIGLSLIGLFALSVVSGNIADIFDDNTMPQSMRCTISDPDQKVSSGFKIHIGTYHETKMSIPAEDLLALGKAPVSFICEAN